MRDHKYEQSMAFKIKLPPVAWRDSATAALPWAGPWSAWGQRRNILFWRRVDRGWRPWGALLGHPGWPPEPWKRLKVDLLCVFSHVELLEPVDWDSVGKQQGRYPKSCNPVVFTSFPHFSCLGWLEGHCYRLAVRMYLKPEDSGSSLTRSMWTVF